MPKYLIVGGGKLAHHLKNYFKLLDISYDCWERKSHSQSEFDKKIKQNDICLLCVSDDAILEFVKSCKAKIKMVHFSGSLEISGALGFHPLMTFDNNEYSLETYKNIGFVGTDPEHDFKQSFPSLQNSYYQISKAHKKSYHAFCTMVGNGTTLLWKIFANELSEMNIPQKAWLPFLKQTIKNIEEDSESRFTGPWYRKDFNTIEKHMAHFYQTPYENLYKSLYELSQKRSE